MLQEEDNAWSFQRVLSYCTWIWEQANDLVAATAYPNIFELPEPTSKKEDLGLVELACPEDPTVDIIAIHGLNGHREKTWMTDDGVLWLRQFLPSSLPRARILTYGYDADTHSTECVSTQTMRRHAVGLAQAILRKRKDARRPIIFVAHDLGGIILKWALVICNNEDLESKDGLRNIVVSTHSILFFGTPHSGVEDTLLKKINLHAHSDELENIQSLYLTASKKINSVFFCEEYSTGADEQQIHLNVPYHSAVIAGDQNAIAVVLHSDHQNLVRFQTEESEDYQAVAYYLTECAENAPDAVHKKWFMENNLRTVVKGGTIPQPDDALFVSQLPVVAFAPSSVHTTCLQGTRQAVLETISQWADGDSSEKPIFWLCDIAGSGKSTVAMTAMEKWKKQGILGGGFFFSMASSESSDIEKFCSTMARELAQHIPELGTPIAEIVKRNPALLRASFDQQFRMLITDPLQHRQTVVLVLDALDECKSGAQRKELVETLASAAQESKNLRIFITSRPDPVVERVLEPLSIKAKLTDRLHDASHRDNIDDVAIYVHRLLGRRLTPDKIQRLVDKAKGLFIWASTACRMLDDESSAVNTAAIYDRLTSIDQPGAIDEVYDLVFERIDRASKPAIIEMLGMLLAAFEPLTTHDLEDLVQHTKGQGSAEALVRILEVYQEDPITCLIQFRHPTFVEYLRRRCSTEIIGDCDRNLINIARAHGQAASWCLHTLKSRKEGLKFNICQIESSFYLNRQITDLDARVAKFISRRLRYASLHWPFHVAAMDSDWGRRLRNELARIVKSPFALYWMEILSVTGGVMRAVFGMRAATQHNSLEQEIRGRMNDIRRFLMAFSVPIQDSAPHIYISSLPFSPRKSVLHTEGLKEYMNSLIVTRGLEETFRELPRTLLGHQRSVTAVSFSPDGTRIVSGSSDRTIRQWDAETGQPLGEPLQGHEYSVNAVAFSPDGTRIVSGSSDRTIRQWDAETGQPLGEPLQGHEDEVMAVAFSPDGTRIVSGSRDRTIRQWDAETGQPLGEPLQGHEDSVMAVAFSPDGTRIVSGSRDRTIRQWDAETGQPLGEPLQGHESLVYAVAFSPDGTRIVSGSRDRTIRQWDAETGQPLGEPLQGHEYWVNAVAFSPDGTRIVSGSSDSTIRQWDAETGQPLGEPLQGHEYWVNAVAFSPDGTRIVSGSSDSTIRQWDAETGQPLGEPLQGHEYSVNAVAFSPDGTRIVSGSRDSTIRQWDAETGQPLGEPLQGHESWVNAVAFSPDGTRIVSGSRDSTIRQWDAETGQPLGEPLQGHEYWVNAVAFSPDGTRIVSGSRDSTIRQWDAETGQPLGEPLQGHEDEVMAVAFSPDGTRIVSGSRDSTIRQWDAETGQPLGEPLQGHEDEVMAVAFSPDGTRIVSGSSDSTIRQWDAETGQPLGEPLQGHEDEVMAVAFSPDGTRIVSGSSDSTIRQWDAETGQPLGEPLQGHESWVNAVAFSPDGTRIVSGSSDSTIRQWDAETGQPLGEPLQGHESFVNTVACSPDGTQVVSGSIGKTIQILSSDNVFGCLAYVFVPKSQRNALDSHTEKCIFVGYPSDRPGWVFWNLQTRKIIHSDSAVFDERVFPGTSFAKEPTPNLSDYIQLPDLEEINTSSSSIPPPDTHPPVHVAGRPVPAPIPHEPVPPPAPAPAQPKPQFLRLPESRELRVLNDQTNL
ncbi:SubName: Full=Related to WD40-repeat protein (Notchless protein) {ECO:0000313/EMBL:CCA73885.1} [Serendipita indica DSM 11827]|nr:SubName: Full=Related to WD40-repeat protein (Notchless protein) {ECO:0000313/EMBL:CCA73885.1} [Serendipita indica DSM 11827]